jgi:Secretion system C-terminal sorting domain
MNKPYLKLTAFLFLFLFNRTFGQNIPDANFAAAIRAACSTCIDANDNLTPSASTITTLNVNNKNISSLAGVDGFTQLNILECEHNKIASITALPSTLTQLFCEDNKITALPSSLPVNMTILALKSNMLTSLPTLPTTLTKLNITFNQIGSLPTLPPNLESLSAYSNLLTSIPTLPSSIRIFGVSYNRLNALPTLPEGVTFVDCSLNQITTLPSIPSTVTFLDCSLNQISTIPVLPNSLTYLSCGNNASLSSLPTLPSDLKTLNASSSQLGFLPALPNGLTTLDISSSNITCLPPLPNTLTSLITSGTSITCIPNKPPGLTTSLPVCSSGGCTLPLELTDLQSITHDKTIEITWTTSSESNLSDFILERSDDNKKYSPLSIQQPKGDLGSISHYSFIDENPNSINYYRLKINEKDGSFTYSKILSAILNKQKQALAYPNPFENGLKIKTSGSDPSENMHIQLMDITGRIYISKTYISDEMIDTQDIPKGIYIVSVTQGSETMNMKMIKE